MFAISGHLVRVVAILDSRSIVEVHSAQLGAESHRMQVSRSLARDDFQVSSLSDS